MGDDAASCSESWPRDGRFGWGTGSAVVFGCRISWRLLVLGSGKWRLCQPLGLARLQPALLALATQGPTGAGGVGVLGCAKRGN